MDNEIVYQIGGLVIILGGFILGIKFISGQSNQASQETGLATVSGNSETSPNASNEIAEKSNPSTVTQFFLDNENVSLKGRIFHLEKQLTSSQNLLNTVENEKIEIEDRLTKEHIQVHRLQQQLQHLTAVQVEQESTYHKQRQELLAENQYLSDNLRQEVAKRTELQRQFYALTQREKQFEQREQHQQQMIRELEGKNRELSESRVGDTVSLKQQLDHLRDEKRQLEQVVQDYVSNAKKLQSEIAQLIAENRDQKAAHQQAIAEIEALKKQVQTLETEKVRLSHDVKSQTEEAIQDKIQQEQVIAELQQHIRQLEKEHSHKPAKHQTVKPLAKAAETVDKEVKKQDVTEEAATIEQNATTPIEQTEVQAEQVVTQPVETVQPKEEAQPEPVNQVVATEPEATAIATEENPIAEPVTESIVTEVTEVTETMEAVKQETEQSQVSNKIFDGKKFIIVGTLTQINREQAKNLIQEAGGSVTSSPSSKTNYVLVGKSPGDKLKKAQKLGISQLSEAQFLSLLASNH